MPDARFIRRKRFSASHYYRRVEWSSERNLATFGAQREPHFHDWLLEVHTVGPIDPDTGFSVDLRALDEAIESMIGDWNGGDLNTLIPEVASGEVIPSTEVIAKWVFEHLRLRIEPPVRLDRVSVYESPDLGSEYPSGALRD